MAGCKHCDRTKADHRKSVWETHPEWGARHDWENEQTQAPLKPMLAQTTTQDDFMKRITHEKGHWAFERKYDGMRVLVQIQNNQTHLWSRTGLSLNKPFPELTQQHLHFDSSHLLLDGEIVTTPESLENLQLRMGLVDEQQIQALMDKYPTQIIYFDIMHKGNADLTQEPYWFRRAMLEEEISQSDGRMISEQLEYSELFQVFERGWEGAVAKQITSIYEPGKRRATWKKYKIENSIDAVIVGVKPGQGQREGWAGSFEVALWDSNWDDLVHIGNVGAGFTDEQKDWAAAAFYRGETVILEIKYMGRVKTGKMREPRFIRFRQDKTVQECDIHQEG